MTTKCNKLSFGELNRYYLLIILGAISYGSMGLFENESKFFSGKLKYPIIYVLEYSLSLCLSFLFLIIYRIFNKRKISKDNNKQKKINSNSTLIKQITRKEKFLWILLVSIIDFINFTSYSINSIEIFKFFNTWALNIISLSLFSFLILKIKLYRHHYLSIIIISISGVLLDIILGKSLRENLLHNLVNFANEISFCLTYVIYKFMMLKKFIKSYEIFFYQGLIELALSIISLIITTNIGYLDNFYEFIDNLDKKEIFYVLFLLLTEFMYNLSLLLIIDFFSPFHVFLIDVFSELLSYCFYLNENELISSIFTIIICLICLFMLLIFIELIEINCFGISYMTKKNIQLRSKLDIDLIFDIIEDEEEVNYQGYIFDFKNNNTNNSINNDKLNELLPVEIIN